QAVEPSPITDRDLADPMSAFVRANPEGGLNPCSQRMLTKGRQVAAGRSHLDRRAQSGRVGWRLNRRHTIECLVDNTRRIYVHAEQPTSRKRDFLQACVAPALCCDRRRRTDANN